MDLDRSWLTGSHYVRPEVLLPVTRNGRVNLDVSNPGYVVYNIYGKMLVPEDMSYDPDVHLSLRDIAIDDLKNPSVLQVTIRQSKTDLFRRGVSLYVGRTSVCNAKLPGVERREAGTTVPISESETPNTTLFHRCGKGCAQEDRTG